MERTILKQHIEAFLPEAVFAENKQYVEVIVPVEALHSFCEHVKTASELQFDYLISLTAVDWTDHFMLVCHLTSTLFRHIIVVKTRINNRENPVADTVSDLWKTAEFHELEVYDLFGISFRNHPDLRRLFLEDDYGFPLRKDFSDESRMIVK
jgi:NADH:ubiquinone oxidoreductase subunit C